MRIMAELYCERVFEVETVRVEDGEQINWTVVAPNMRVTRSTFRYLLADNKDLKIVTIRRSGTAIISLDTVARITNGGAHSHAA